MWKTRLGRVIHQSSHGAMVHQNLGYRWLTFGGSAAIQTLINRRYPEQGGLTYVPALTIAAQTDPGTCCLLGLGGAGVAHALRASLGEATLYAIENNQDIIQIAKTYFMSDHIPNLKVIHDDAHRFIHRTTTHFKHVIIDLFGAHAFPEHCFNSDFFAQCRNRLMPEGVLAVNIANTCEQEPILRFMRAHFKQCTVSLPVMGTANLVLLASKSESIMPLLDRLRAHQRLKQLIWDDKWGCIAEIRVLKRPFWW